MFRQRKSPILLSKIKNERKQSKSIEEQRAKTIKKGRRLIGVVGSSSGVGCTFLCLHLALQCSQQGNTALIEMEEQHQLHCFKEKVMRPLAVFQRDSDMITILRQYESIFLDFGNYHDLKNNKVDIKELYRCDYKVFVTDIREWKQNLFIECLEQIEDIENWIIIANLAPSYLFREMSRDLRVVKGANISFYQCEFIENIFQPTAISEILSDLA